MAIPQRTVKVTKAPTEQVRFGRDWSEDLADFSDTIDTVVHTASGGVTITGETNTSTVSVFRVSGGTADTTARVVATVTTTGGDTLVCEWDIYITAT